MNTIFRSLATLALAGSLVLFGPSAHSAAPEDKPFAEHKIVLQISAADPRRQTLVLNVANNLVNHYGADMVDVEIVAFGPGLSLLFADNANSGRIDALADSSKVRFAACENTIAAVTRQRGSVPELNPKATHVNAGVVRIMDLTAQGYTLIKP